MVSLMCFLVKVTVDNSLVYELPYRNPTVPKIGLKRHDLHFFFL